MINFDQLFDVFWETTSLILCTQNMYITSRAFILWCQVVCIFQVIGSVKLITGVQVPHCRFVVDQVHSIKKSQKVISLSREECSFFKGKNWFSEEKRFVFSQFFFLQFLSIFTCNYLRLFTLFMNDFNTCIYLNLYYCNNLQAGC